MKRVDTSKGPIEYRDEGNGPVVVFVHGLLVDGELWRNVVPLLARTHRCIVPTWPLGSHRLPMNAGADLSPPGMAALVAEFLGALDLRDVTLVGNNSGGAVSQLVAARHPERIGSLVLTNCDAFEVFPPKGFGYLKWVPRIPGLMFLLARSMLYVPALRRLRIAYGGLTRRPIPADVLKSWVAPAARSRAVRRDAATFIRGVSPEVTQTVAAELAGFTRPTLILWGKDDPFFRVSLAERLAEAIPNARLDLVDDAGTFVAEDQPERVAAAIAAFPPARTASTPPPSRRERGSGG